MQTCEKSKKKEKLNSKVLKKTLGHTIVSCAKKKKKNQMPAKSCWSLFYFFFKRGQIGIIKWIRNKHKKSYRCSSWLHVMYVNVSQELTLFQYKNKIDKIRNQYSAFQMFNSN